MSGLSSQPPPPNAAFTVTVLLATQQATPDLNRLTVDMYTHIHLSFQVSACLHARNISTTYQSLSHAGVQKQSLQFTSSSKSF